MRSLAVAAILLAPGCASTPKSGAGFEDRLLATIPPDLADFVADSDSRIFFAPDGRTVAYIVHLTGELDEKPRAFVVINGHREPEVGRVGEVEGCFLAGNIRFSRDGRRHAYVYRMGNYERGREGVMVDGSKGPLFDDVSNPLFDSDGRRFSYEARENGKAFVVFDHQPQGREYDKADQPIFSPDGRRTAYRAFKLGEPDEEGSRETLSAFIVVDGVKGAEYDGVGSPKFSPDGKDVVYTAQKEGIYRMIRGATRSAAYDYLGAPVISADGRSLACVAGKDGRFFILVDGREIPSRFESVDEPVLFSPDGRRVAYRGIRDADRGFDEQPPLKRSEGRECMVVDQEAGEDCSFIYEPRFGPDGRLVYTMRQNRDWFVVHGREKFGAEYADVGDPAVSPDGLRVAFVASQGEEMFVVCGSRRSASFEYVRSPVFSPDGKKIGFGARKGRELWWKVMSVK